MNDPASNPPPPSRPVQDGPGVHRGEPDQDGRREPGGPDELQEDVAEGTPGPPEDGQPDGRDLRGDGYVPL
jgi:hypothetical protein